MAATKARKNAAKSEIRNHKLAKELTDLSGGLIQVEFQPTTSTIPLDENDTGFIERGNYAVASLADIFDRELWSYEIDLSKPDPVQQLIDGANRMARMYLDAVDCLENSRAKNAGESSTIVDAPQRPVEQLPKLPVEITRDGERLRTVLIDDPRAAFCRAYNAMDDGTTTANPITGKFTTAEVPALPKLPVEIRLDGQPVKTVLLNDPREGFCRAFNTDEDLVAEPVERSKPVQQYRAVVLSKADGKLVGEYFSLNRDCIVEFVDSFNAQEEVAKRGYRAAAAPAVRPEGGAR